MNFMKTSVLFEAKIGAWDAACKVRRLKEAKELIS